MICANVSIVKVYPAVVSDAFRTANSSCPWCIRRGLALVGHNRLLLGIYNLVYLSINTEFVL